MIEPSRRNFLVSAGSLIASGATSTHWEGSGTTDQERLLWRYNAGAWSSPTIVDGKLYIGSTDSNLYCLDSTTGQKKWQFGTNHYIMSSPAVTQGVVFAAEAFFPGRLFAIDAKTGTELWHYETLHEIESSPTVHQGTVLIESAGVFAINATTGEREWQFTPPDMAEKEEEERNASQSSLVVADGTVFYGDRSNNLYALDAADGEVEWQFDAGLSVASIISTPAIYTDMVLFGNTNGDFFAVDKSTGEERWSFNVGDVVWSSPTVYDKTVFFGSLDSSVYALNVTDGTKRWKFKTGDAVWSSPTVVGDTVFVGSNDNQLYAIDRTYGNKRWAFDAGKSITSSPTVVDGVAYAGTDPGGGLDEMDGGWIFAVETDESGSSQDSRVTEGALGHHHSWSRSVEPFPSPKETSSNTKNGVASELLIPGAATGVAAACGLGYLLKRQSSDDAREK